METFHRATLLSKIVPRTADEAQYNIAYPVAASLIYGDFGYAQLCNLGDPQVVDMMRKLHFVTDSSLDAQFPARRICRVKIETADGRTLTSPECEPRGEACENIGLDWLSKKFLRITAPVLEKEKQQALLKLLTQEEDLPLRTIVELAK